MGDTPARSSAWRRSSFARGAAGLVAALCLALGARPARASDGEDASASLTRGIVGVRAFNEIEIGIGALTVPRSNLCIPNVNTCTTSDLTLLGSLNYSVRLNGAWAFGGGASIGFRPVSDDASIQSSQGTISRTHNRNYFLLLGNARYYPVSGGNFEFWVGGTGGAVIVADRYALTDPGTSIIGPTAVTVDKEGVVLGAGFGANFRLGRSWSIGLFTTEMVWFLSQDTPCAQTNDCSTVKGDVFSFEAGLSVIYRVPL